MDYPPSLPVPFGRDAVPPYIHVVPIPSQEGITPGAASWATGFVPLNMTLVGGVPPFGSDVNGVLNYLSANLVWAAGGGAFKFNGDIVSLGGGYPIGVVLGSGVTASLRFYNTVNNNTNDPDSNTTGWTGHVVSPLHATLVTASGANTDLTGFGAGATLVDLNPTAGNSTIVSILPAFDGQEITFANIHVSNQVTMQAYTSGPTAHQIRLPTDLTLLQFQTMTLKYYNSLGLWVPR